MRKGKTRSDAEKELAAKLDEVDNATFVSKTAVLFFSKVAEDWLEVKKSNLPGRKLKYPELNFMPFVTATLLSS